MLDARRLRILCEVAKHRSFSSAAEALGYTQPAVSRQISVLEAETGTILVRRLRNGAVLTDAGRLLVERGRAILLALDNTELELQALLGLGGGRLRMAAFASAATAIVPTAVLRFRERYPAVDLAVAVADPAETLPRMSAGELDLILSHDPGRYGTETTELEVINLFDDPFNVALPLGHPLAGAGPLAIAALADESWMIGTTTTCPDARAFHRACEEAGFAPHVTLESDDYPAVLGLVAAGMGVALVPELVTRAVPAQIAVCKLDPAPPPRRISLAVPAGYRSPATAAMVAVLREIAEEWLAGAEAWSDSVARTASLPALAAAPASAPATNLTATPAASLTATPAANLTATPAASLTATPGAGHTAAPAASQATAAAAI